MSTASRGRALLASMFTVGVIGFGGGSALIPVIENQIVTKRNLIDEDTYTRQTIVGNITPGALPVKLGAFAGLTLSGAKLALLAALIVALPGTLATVALVALSSTLGPAAVNAISYASVGINAFIIVLLFGYIAKVLRNAGRRLVPYIVIMALTAIVSGPRMIVGTIGMLFGQHWDVALPKLSAVQVILTALGLIVIYSLFTRRAGAAETPASDDAKDFGHFVKASVGFLALMLAGMALFTVLFGMKGLRFAGLLALSTVTSFGGGEAYVAVADGFFVGGGMIDGNFFYTQLVPIANALPGPILVKLAMGMAYVLGLPTSALHGWAAALGALAITAGSCCALAVLVYGAYDRLKHNTIFVNISTYVLPVICGLLITTALTMLEVSAGIAETAGYPPVVTAWISVVAIVIMFVIHVRKLIPDLALLLISGAASLAWLML